MIGKVSFEFIASGKHIFSFLRPLFNYGSTGIGRMWSVTFFSSNPSSTAATSGKSKLGTNSWHVMISLLESSPPTFFDSLLVVEVPPPFVPDSARIRRIREVRSTSFPLSRNVQHQNRSSMYDSDYDGKPHSRSSRGHDVPRPSEAKKYPSPSSSKPPPPTHPISIRLSCGTRKLARRTRSEPPGTHLNSRAFL